LVIRCKAEGIGLVLRPLNVRTPPTAVHA
jgi:hypothetical protein